MKFKKIVNYLSRLRKVIVIIYTNRKYIRNGFLQADVRLKYVINHNLKSLDFARRVLIKNNYKFTKKLLFDGLIKIPFFSFSSKSFHGDICLLSNSDNKSLDVKFFDLESNNVLTKYSKSEDLIKKISNYNLFSSHFRSPDLISYDLDDKISIEKYIDTIPKKTWKSNEYRVVVNSIFNDYIKYYYSLDLKNNYLNIANILNDFLIYEKKIDTLSFILDNLILFKNYDIPLIYQHGDLWFYNILLDKNKNVFYIDWEHSNMFCFFYDIFWWIVNEFIYENNNEFLNNYLLGKYDNQFDNLFLSVNKKYNKDLRKIYLYIFVAELFSKRILLKSDSVINDADQIYFPALLYTQKFKTH